MSEQFITLHRDRFLSDPLFTIFIKFYAVYAALIQLKIVTFAIGMCPEFSTFFQFGVKNKATDISDGLYPKNAFVNVI